MLVGGLATQSKSCSSKWESFSQTFRATQYPQIFETTKLAFNFFWAYWPPLPPKKWAFAGDIISFCSAWTPLVFCLLVTRLCLSVWSRRYPGFPRWLLGLVLLEKPEAKGQQGCDKEAWLLFNLLLLLLLLLFSACPSSSCYYFVSSCSSCRCCYCCAFFVLK